MKRFIVVDTREKPKAIKRILEYFDRNNIKHVSSKLLFGDYMDYNRPWIVIDRKQNIAELAKNCTTEHERFRREIELAAEAGATLVILVEQNRYQDRGKWVHVNSIEDLILWSSPHSMVRGEKLFRILAAWASKFPIQVIFCDKRATGQNIIKILYSEDYKPRTRE